MRTKIGLDGVKNEGRWVGKPISYDSVYKITENDKDKGIFTNEEEAKSFARYLSNISTSNRYGELKSI